MLSDQTIILLCPKTTFALLGTDRAEWQEIPLEHSMKYGEACAKVIGKAKFVGETCIKNINYEVKNRINALKLLY